MTKTPDLVSIISPLNFVFVSDFDIRISDFLLGVAMNKKPLSRRRGLAPLELTLALPILLFVMALIINYGTISAWKVREHSVARLAVWETRWPRSGSTDPRPSYWPATASMESSDQGNVAEMDVSRVDLPVARGPLPNATVNSELLDPTRGLHEGSASLTRKFAMLGTMGSLHDQLPNVVDRRQMAIPADGNGQQLAAADSGLVRVAQAPASLVNAYVQSVLACAGDFAEPTGAAGSRSQFHLLRRTFRLGRHSRLPPADPIDVHVGPGAYAAGRPATHQTASPAGPR